VQVGVRYMAQVKQAAGVAAEQVHLEGPCSVEEFIVRLAERHGEPLRKLLLKAGSVQPTILLFVGDVQVHPGDGTPLQDGDVVTVLSPIAGG
jgi:molybdopterin converting factor small subunit